MFINYWEATLTLPQSFLWSLIRLQPSHELYLGDKINNNGLKTRIQFCID